MDAAPEVRRAGPAETDEAFALPRRFFAKKGFGTPPERLRERLAVLLADGSGAVFLARRGDAAVGAAMVITTFGLKFGRIAELEDLYVLPHARGRRDRPGPDRRGARLVPARGLRAPGGRRAPEGQAAGDLRGYYRRHGFRESGRTLLFAEPTPGPAS